MYGMPYDLEKFGDCFKRQRDALELWNTQRHRRILSYDCCSSYRLENDRREIIKGYVVIDADVFWDFYKNETEQKFFYEVIPEDTPCRLYFDLEFKINCNNNLDGPSEVKKFCEVVGNELETFFDQLSGKINDKNFLILQSDSPGKFSAHVIVHLPNRALFQSNVHMKIFVDRVIKFLYENRVGLVLNEQYQPVPICDTAVYSKNRSFRIYKSTKPMQRNPLYIAPYNCFYGNSVPEDSQVLKDAWVVPDIDNSSPFEILDQCQRFTQKPQCNKLCEMNLVGSNDAVSPFPMTQDFIIEINRRYKSQVSIRSWKIFPGTTVGINGFCAPRIAYQLRGSRYCFNVGREHKSNQVYWVVNVTDKYCVQRCFDPDCAKAGFMSRRYPLPYCCSYELETNRSNSLFRSITVKSKIQDSRDLRSLSSVDTEQVRKEEDEVYDDSFYDPSTDSIFLK